MTEELQVAQVDNSEKKSHKKYISPVALAIYGETFVGYDKLSDYNDLLPSFKEWYYQKKVANDKETITNILRTFNSEVCAPLNRKFHPKVETVRTWRKKWDMDLIQKVK